MNSIGFSTIDPYYPLHLPSSISQLLNKLVDIWPEWKAYFIFLADCLNVLLKLGADACAQNDDGDTPLHIAAASGLADCCALLLQNGANMALKNNVGPPNIVTTHSICSLSWNSAVANSKNVE